LLPLDQVVSGAKLVRSTVAVEALARRTWQNELLLPDKQVRL
jgi:hypothetical protein